MNDYDTLPSGILVPRPKPPPPAPPPVQPLTPPSSQSCCVCGQPIPDDGPWIGRDMHHRHRWTCRHPTTHTCCRCYRDRHEARLRGEPVYYPPCPVCGCESEYT